MESDAINFLCAADLHLGRQVFPPNSTSNRSRVVVAWQRLIDMCLNTSSSIDALLLAGDILDGEDSFIEMYGVIKKGLIDLCERNIPVIAVAGNHDANILEKFCRIPECSRFYVLGSSGEWERLSLSLKGRTIHIDGCSFTSSFMTENPFLRLHREESPADRYPRIGILHCDVDTPSSQYGPVRSSDFDRFPHCAWVLGHTHIPKNVREHGPLVRYCGSLQGLDVSEHGPRGPWILQIDGSGTGQAKPISLAPLRWEHIQIDVSSFEERNWKERILEQLEQTAATWSESNIESVGWRISLRGKSAIFRELRQHIHTLSELRDLECRINGRWIPYFIESIRSEVRPLLDVRRIAEGSDVAAVLARHILRLQEDPSQRRAAYEQILQKLEKDPFLRQCPTAWPSEAECEELALHQGYELLDELLRSL